MSLTQVVPVVPRVVVLRGATGIASGKSCRAHAVQQVMPWLRHTSPHHDTLCCAVPCRSTICHARPYPCTCNHHSNCHTEGYNRCLVNSVSDPTALGWYDSWTHQQQIHYGVRRQAYKCYMPDTSACESMYSCMASMGNGHDHSGQNSTGKDSWDPTVETLQSQCFSAGCSWNEMAVLPG